MRNPKAKFRVEIYFGKPIKGIGSTTSFNTDKYDENSPIMDHYKGTAKSSNTTLQVIVLENKDVYPKFNWEKVNSYFVNL